MRRRRNFEELIDLPPLESEKSDRNMYYIGYFVAEQGEQPREPNVLIGPMNLTFLENTITALLNVIKGCGTYEAQYDPFTDKFLAFVAHEIFCYSEVETTSYIMLDGQDSFVLAVDGMVCSFVNMTPRGIERNKPQKLDDFEESFEAATLIPKSPTLEEQVRMCLALVDHSGIGWEFLGNPNVEPYLNELRRF